MHPRAGGRFTDPSGRAGTGPRLAPVTVPMPPCRTWDGAGGWVGGTKEGVDSAAPRQRILNTVWSNTQAHTRAPRTGFPTPSTLVPPFPRSRCRYKPLTLPAPLVAWGEGRRGEQGRDGRGGWGVGDGGSWTPNNFPLYTHLSVSLCLPMVPNHWSVHAAQHTLLRSVCCATFLLWCTNTISITGCVCSAG